MVTISGIALDFNTNKGLEYIQIVALSSSGIVASGITKPTGYFSFNVPDQELTYTIYEENYVGYTKQVPSGLHYINLYARYSEDLPSITTVNLDNNVLSTAGRVLDIKNSPTHYYVITEGGLDVIDVNTFNNVAYIKAPNEFTCVSLNSRYIAYSGILIGTTNSGVLEFNIPNYDNLPSRDIQNLIQLKYNEANSKVTNNHINCMDQNYNSEVVIGTISGIDYITSNGVRYYTLYSGISGTNACQISELGDIYYSPTNSGLHVKYSPTGDWSLPDYTVILSGTGANPFPLLSNYINDIAIKSISGSNSVFLATRSGLIGYDEDRGNLDNSANAAFLIRNYP